MNLLFRILQRIISLSGAAFLLWIIVTQIFDRLDERLPAYLAIILTYILSAYLLLPQVVRIFVMIRRRKHIPHVTYTSDGLPADPVNIILKGTYRELINAFEKAGWSQADTLTIRSSIHMIRSFLLNKPYPTAPFSSLYLFGRKQDIGFQETISKGPSKRHHVRFWAANINPDAELGDITYWISDHPINYKKPIIWVGAGTEDLGLGLTSFTYQISHRSDKEIDRERDYIFTSLHKQGSITNDTFIQAGTLIEGKYQTDGKIISATLR